MAADMLVVDKLKLINTLVAECMALLTVPKTEHESLTLNEVEPPMDTLPTPQIHQSASNTSLQSVKSTTEKKRCIHIITKKDKKGQPCGGTISSHSTTGNYCVKHFKIYEGAHETKKRATKTTKVVKNTTEPLQTIKNKKMVITLNKDESGNLVHKETGFIFDDKNCVTGLKTQNGIAKLSERDIIICNSYGFKFSTDNITRIDENTIVKGDKEDDDSKLNNIKQTFETSANYENLNEDEEEEEEDEKN